MTSLAMRTRARKLGMKSAAKGQSAPRRAASERRGAQASEYELQRAQLGDDIRQLKTIQSVEAKIELKHKLLPKYDPWVEGIIAGAKGDDGNFQPGKGIQDDILIHTMIWAIDTGDIARAMPRAEYALRYELDLPSRFDRTLGCLVAEEFAENALRAAAQDEPIDLESLLEIEALTEAEDMPDQARAKLHKAIAQAIVIPDADAQSGPAGGRRAAIEAALAHFRRALALHDKVGVKKDIERLDRELKKLTETKDT